MLNLYTGFDPREEIGWHVFCSSVMHRTTEAVAFIPIHGPQRDGTNAFTYARFLVPELNRRKGFAIFADGCDMIVGADIRELMDLADPSYAVQVVKHDYKTRHPRKYLGTSMEAPNEDYPRKNWSSLMLINCEHDAWRRLYDIFTRPGHELHRFAFLEDNEIGRLPIEWNWLADEYGPNPDAKLLHWTAGIPAFPAYAHGPHANDWAAAAVKVTHAVS
jgi:hypothetical protein